MRGPHPLSILVFSGLLALGVGLAVLTAVLTSSAVAGAGVAAGFVLLACLAASAIKIASQWDRAVVMRLGRFRGLSGPGFFLIIPIWESVAYWIDVRVIATPFNAEKTLTQDTVPVDVDAVLFWKVLDPEKAALEVVDYQGAIAWAAQTALRDVIGKTVLADMLVGREKIDAELQTIIDQRAAPWGLRVSSVEIRDVIIPAALQDAMSMQAQAERERQARVILGESELQIAEKFAAAARSYEGNPTALHLRAMNMLYEGLKANASLVIVPSSAVETMQLGGLAGITALAQAQAGAAGRADGASAPNAP